jgi:hypothetical protein
MKPELVLFCMLKSRLLLGPLQLVYELCGLWYDCLGRLRFPGEQPVGRAESREGNLSIGYA